MKLTLDKESNSQNCSSYHVGDLPFTKMHGLGNDFVIIDARYSPLSFTGNKKACVIADRYTGIGCDQVIIVTLPRTTEASIAISIYNADGSEVQACGNATRCVGAMFMDALACDTIVVETQSGLRSVYRETDDLVAVNMGVPNFDWWAIPLATAVDTMHIPLTGWPHAEAIGISMGNPHVVIFVTEIELINLSSIGASLEKDSLFPEHTNVEIAQVFSQSHLRVRVWERGVGITRSCGTGACASVVAAIRHGLLARRRTEVIMDGGCLFVTWREDNQVVLSGQTETSFTGLLSDNLISRLF